MKSEPSPPAKTWQLLELWERARDGRLSDAERARLDDLVRNDTEARRILAEAALMDAELRYDGGAGIDLQQAAKTAAPARVTWRWPHGIAAAAAAIIASAVTGLAWNRWVAPHEAAPVATLAKAHQCKWGNSALPTLEGGKLAPGTLELLEGMATLRFNSGAEVVMEAPVSLEVVSAMECRIKRGTVVADVPHTAKGFTVQTPDTKVVDYGTRFGVSASDDGKCLVHVIEGEVEVNRPDKGEVKRLQTGQRVDYGGWTQSRVYPDASPNDQREPDRWLPGPISDMGDGWQMITTAFGSGRDSWIQSNNTTRITGAEPFLRIKHSTKSETLDRKAYVAFDLSRFAGRRVQEAEFVLHVEPSDLGFASLVPDATFLVYGLTDETQDSWDENELSWKKAPAHDPGAGHDAPPVAAQSRLLGQFVVTQGTTRGSFSIRTPELTEFLAGDTNGVSTLIICRETDELANNGLVHAFASKENARNAPPSLRVKLAE